MNYSIRYVQEAPPCQSDSLMHFGIKGQKWGVRRFQNDDGTYTSEGRERYGIGDDRQSKKFVKLANESNQMGSSAGQKAKKKLLKTKKMKELLADKEINEKRDAYRKVKDELRKASKGEDYDAWSEDDNQGISAKRFEMIRKLTDQKVKAYNDYSSTVKKRVNDFVGDHARTSVSKIKANNRRINDDVNKWISNVVEVELNKRR